MAAQGNHEDVARNLITRGANLQAVTGVRSGFPLVHLCACISLGFVDALGICKPLAIIYSFGVTLSKEKL